MYKMRLGGVITALLLSSGCYSRHQYLKYGIDQHHEGIVVGRALANNECVKVIDDYDKAYNGQKNEIKSLRNVVRRCDAELYDCENPK